MVQRRGVAVIRLLENVRLLTINFLIQGYVRPGTAIYTDEYAVYSHLSRLGFSHSFVCHSRGEYARDDGGDGVREVHVNTVEGLWSLLRAWLRPHRGISQEKLPSYLALFKFAYNNRARGSSLLPLFYVSYCLSSKVILIHNLIFSFN